MSATQTKLTRAEAARINGAKGKGPATAEGKAKSSQNALKHGFSAAKWLALPDEDASDYEAFFDEMLEDLAPQGAEQKFYAARMIECMWRLRRIPTLEARMANPKPHEFDHRCHTGFNLRAGWSGMFQEIARYETSLERTLERNRKALRALQNEPKKETHLGVGEPIRALLPGEARPNEEVSASQNEPKPEAKERRGTPAETDLSLAESREVQILRNEPKSLHERRTLELAEFYLEDHPDLSLEEAIEATSPHLPTFR